MRGRGRGARGGATRPMTQREPQQIAASQNRTTELEAKINAVLKNHSGKVEQTAERRRLEYGNQHKNIDKLSYITPQENV